MYKRTKMPLEDIKVEAPFKDLFTINPDDLKGIKKDMDVDYDLAHPIVLWKEKMIVVDGHTRLQAAKELGYEEIPVVLISFESVKEAVEYAIHNQTERRNLTDWDILSLVELIDARSHNWGGVREALEKQETEAVEKGKKGKIASFSLKKLAIKDKVKEEMKGKLFERVQKYDSRRKTAVYIGISMQKVSMCRKILEWQDQKMLDAIKKGEMTLSRAYKTILMWDENRALRREEQRRARAKKMDYDLFFKGKGKGAEKAFRGRMKHLDNLSLNLVPELLRKDPIIKRMHREVQFFADQGERAVKALQDQQFIQELLKSPFLTDLISILEMFGFSVQWPKGFIPVKRPEPKKKRSGFDISKVHDADYAHNKELSKYGEIGEQSAESDIRKGRI